MTGKYGVAVPYDTEALSSTRQPCVRWECTHSYTRRDLPTPASPTSATTWPWPALACTRACCMTTSSWSARQSVSGPAPQPPASAAGSAGPEQLAHLHRLHEPFDGDRPQGVDLHQALDQA